MKTTFGRIFTTAVAILLLSLVLMGFSFQALAGQYLEQSSIESLQRNCATLADLASAYATNGQLANRDFLVNLDVVSQTSDTDVVICSAAGRVILCSDSITGCDHRGLWVDQDYLQKVLTTGEVVATGLVEGLYGETRHVVSRPIRDPVTGADRGIIIVSRPTGYATRIMSRISSSFVAISLLVILLSIGVMLLLLQRQSDPLKQMARTARAFGHGDLDARVRLEEGYPEEVEDLALAFNNMAQELQKSEYQRKEFVTNVSHELKTPMTTIAGYVDGILDGTIPEQRHQYYLRIVSDETKRLSRLVRSMLDISLLQDQGGIPEDKKLQFDLEECASQVLITFEQKITQKELTVQVQMPEHPVYTHASPDYVTQVIYNLIDNAVKFSPPGGTLGLSIQVDDSKIYVSISNDGDTIPPEELPLVFDRFHKTDKSRSQNREGWGLGLYIVKTIVCSHGENISVASREGRTTFTFTMPLVN